MKAHAISTLKAAVGLAAVPAVAVFSGPAVVAAAALAAFMVGAMCWVLADTKRAARLALLIRVSRSNGTAQIPANRGHADDRPGEGPN